MVYSSKELLFASGLVCVCPLQPPPASARVQDKSWVVFPFFLGHGTLHAGLPALGGQKKGVVEADPLDHTGRVAATYLENNMLHLVDELWEILLPRCPSRRQT